MSSRLTPAETRVALQIVRGLSGDEVARRLYLSPHTVHEHLRRIRDRLDGPGNVRDRIYRWYIEEVLDCRLPAD